MKQPPNAKHKAPSKYLFRSYKKKFQVVEEEDSVIKTTFKNPTKFAAILALLTQNNE